MRVLVTGGAGFIGTHLARALTARGHHVTILDALVEQVHGPDAGGAVHSSEEVEFVLGDVRDIDAWRRCLDGCEVVVHLAAEVGVGQSMYEIVRYISANSMGTANLLQLLASEDHTVRKVIVASSMSIYGEGAYRCPGCGPVLVQQRPPEQLDLRAWEMRCPTCCAELQPVATPEHKPLHPTSVYAVSKRDQEELCLAVGQAYHVPTVALRFFNTYGPGQALSNPYTGVVAIFASRLLNGNPPLVFEDGQQSRDFVHVSDVVQALLLAMEQDQANYEAFNIGSGTPRSVNQVAMTLADTLGVDIQPQIVNQFRQGDIRHCFADIGKARKMLGYEPNISFSEGIKELVDWLKTQTAHDAVNGAKAELDRRGLTQ